jgi:hypothetical protein
MFGTSSWLALNLDLTLDYVAQASALPASAWPHSSLAIDGSWPTLCPGDGSSLPFSTIPLRPSPAITVDTSRCISLGFFRFYIPSVRVLQNICMHFPHFLLLSSSLVCNQGFKLSSMLRNYRPHSFLRTASHVPRLTFISQSARLESNFDFTEQLFAWCFVVSHGTHSVRLSLSL